jgi:hypothetical protein
MLALPPPLAAAPGSALVMLNVPFAASCREH